MIYQTKTSSSLKVLEMSRKDIEFWDFINFNCVLDSFSTSRYFFKNDTQNYQKLISIKVWKLSRHVWECHVIHLPPKTLSDTVEKVLGVESTSYHLKHLKLLKMRIIYFLWVDLL